MATAVIEVAHVYKAMGEILKHLSVSKDKKLPSNMGGSGYATAEDVSVEVKRLFVENNLILLPDEETIGQEAIIHKDRLNIRVHVRGTYTIVSTEDGSKAVISAVGDGLATGTAVAANIASTFALKNALLRTFMISDSAVEERGMKDTANAERPQVGGKTSSALGKAQAAASKPAAKAAGPTWRARVKTDFLDTEKADKDTVNALLEGAKGEGLKGDALWEQVHQELSGK